MISLLLPLARGLGDGRIGNATVVLSIQSITRTFGILLLVVCVLECAATVGDGGGDKRDSIVCCWEKSRDERGNLVYVNALCSG